MHSTRDEHGTAFTFIIFFIHVCVVLSVVSPKFVFHFVNFVGAIFHSPVVQRPFSAFCMVCYVFSTLFLGALLCHLLDVMAF